MDKRTTTVHMDAQGRLYIPKPVRESLGVAGETATLEVDVGVLDT